MQLMVICNRIGCTAQLVDVDSTTFIYSRHVHLRDLQLNLADILRMLSLNTLCLTDYACLLYTSPSPRDS